MEFKRIFSKIITFSLILLLSCTALFVYQQYKNAQFYDINFLQSLEFRKVLSEKIKSMNINDAEKYIAESLKKNNVDTQLYVLSDFSDTIEYIKSYPEYLESIRNNAKRLQSFSIFSDTDSLANKNISKTVEDYAELENVELSLVNDKALESVTDFGFIHYAILIFSVILSFQLIAERKRGLWGLVHSTPNGRAKLAYKRIFLIICCVTVFTFTAYITLYTCAFMLYGGMESIFASAQSFEILQNFTLPINALVFLIIYISVNALTQSSLAILIWFILSGVHNRSIAIGISGVIFGAEFLLYQIIPSQSNLAIFKYTNVFYLINPSEPIVTYTNVFCFVTLINLFTLVSVTAILIILIFSILGIINQTKTYPYKTENVIEYFILKLLNKISIIYHKAVEHLPTTGFELYKLLIMQKGIVVLIALSFILFSSATTNEIIYGGTDELVQDFYREYSGPVTDDTLEHINFLHSEIESFDIELSQAYSDYINGVISKDEYNQISMRSYAYDEKREALNIIDNHVNYVNSQNANGNDAWLVNTVGYENLLGTESNRRHLIYYVLSVFSLIVMFSGIFTFEKRNGMFKTLNSTANGRIWLTKRKYFSAAIITVTLWIIAILAELYDVCSQYPLPDLEAPVQSIEFLGTFPLNISIVSYIALGYSLNFFILLAISFVICTISKIIISEKIRIKRKL